MEIGGSAGGTPRCAARDAVSARPASSVARMDFVVSTGVSSLAGTGTPIMPNPPRLRSGPTALVLVLLLPLTLAAQQAAPAVQPIRFAGTWVGTQRWVIENPPPGSRQDQPVTLTIEVVDGKISGAMTPFLGGDDGATIVEATVVGDELRATALVGRPRTGRGRGTGWKDPIRVTFAFTADGVNLRGTADVAMGDVPWMKFGYELSKKRSRY